MRGGTEGRWKGKRRGLIEGEGRWGTKRGDRTTAEGVGGTADGKKWYERHLHMRMHLMLTAAQILSHAGMRPTASAATSSASTSSQPRTPWIQPSTFITYLLPLHLTRLL